MVWLTPGILTSADSVRSNQQVYNKANIYVFAQLATGIVYEMGLFKPEAKGKHMLLCVHTEPHENRSEPPRHIMDERRAVLGCFLLTSWYACPLLFGCAANFGQHRYLSAAE